jgi:transposase
MKTSERDMARKLRAAGLSVREIEQRLDVSRPSVSLWVRDVESRSTEASSGEWLA